jgi:hypothetical protein
MRFTVCANDADGTRPGPWTGCILLGGGARLTNLHDFYVKGAHRSDERQAQLDQPRVFEG